MTDKELERIYNEGYRAVYWTAMQLLKNESDAEDVVQDTFVALIESYDTIKDKDKVIPWLKKIAANKCLNRLTRTKADAVENEFFEDVEALPEDFLPDSIAESEEARRIIMDIIERSLSDDIRRTLILFYFDEMSTMDIAEALGVPEGTVRRRLNFARTKIKKEVEKYEEDNKTKLFGMALPFLSKLFIKEAEQVPFKAMPAKLASLSASAQASHAGAATKVAASAAKKGTGIMINKVLIGSIAAVVGVGAVVGIAIGIMSKKADTKPETVTSEVTVNDVTEQTDGSIESETAGTSDIAPISANIRGVEMRDLTDDDLFACIYDVTYKNDLTAQYVYCYAWNGSIEQGDEIKVIGTYGAKDGDEEEIYLTDYTMLDEFGRTPIAEAHEGDRFVLELTGDSMNRKIEINRSVVFADSDIEPAIGVKFRVTLEPGAEYVPDSRYDWKFGTLTEPGASELIVPMTLIEQNGDELVLYVEFIDGKLPAYPGGPCTLAHMGIIAKGEVVAVYLEE